jgi:hypothetical protein
MEISEQATGKSLVAIDHFGQMGAEAFIALHPMRPDTL